MAKKDTRRLSDLPLYSKAHLWGNSWTILRKILLSVANMIEKEKVNPKKLAKKLREAAEEIGSLEEDYVMVQIAVRKALEKAWRALAYKYWDADKRDFDMSKCIDDMKDEVLSENGKPLGKKRAAKFCTWLRKKFGLPQKA